MLPIFDWADVVINVFPTAMVGVSIDALVDVKVTPVLISLELAKPSSYDMEVPTDGWEEAFIGIDSSIDMRIGELTEVLARMWVGVMTSLNISMPASSEERLWFR